MIPIKITTLRMANLATSPLIIKDRMVPVDAIRELSSGSYEHLSLRIDAALKENASRFVGESNAQVAVVATFPGHVVIGSDDGRYFRCRYEDKDGQITFGLSESLDVPIIDTSNSKEFIHRYAMSAVDAILSGNKEESRERLLGLIGMEESAAAFESVDLADLVRGLLKANRPWRQAFSEKRVAIREHLKDIISSIDNKQMETKYVGLYDGSIPEEKFGNYASIVAGDLSVLADRYESVQTRAESAFYPFTEAVAESQDGRSQEDEEVLQQFAAFSEDFIEDIHELREHLAFAQESEPCVMCLGQIYDAMAEALTDYDIAGSFVERMAKTINEAA